MIELSERNVSEIYHHMAELNLGLYNPSDLHNSLTRIARSNDVTSWKPESYDADELKQTAYFLGHDIACKIWSENSRPQIMTPYFGIELNSVHLPEELSQFPQNVISLGCTGIHPYELEQQTLNRLGITRRDHWTVDISHLPLNRIAQSKRIKLFTDNNEVPQLSEISETNTQSSLLNSDARHTPFPDAYFDLAITDFMFNAASPHTEPDILRETARTMKSKGQLILRGLVTSDAIAENICEINKHIGLFWYNRLLEKVGTILYTKKDALYSMSPDQWEELGSLYASFVNNNYFGQNRYKKEGDIFRFIESGGIFEVKESAPIRQYPHFNGDQPTIYVIRAEKVT